MRRVHHFYGTCSWQILQEGLNLYTRSGAGFSEGRDIQRCIIHAKPEPPLNGTFRRSPSSLQLLGNNFLACQNSVPFLKTGVVEEGFRSFTAAEAAILHHENTLNSEKWPLRLLNYYAFYYNRCIKV